MKKKKKLFEGRTKKIFETEDSDQWILEFKDDFFAYESVKNDKVIIKGKGIINSQISSHLFEYLEGFHVPTHFIKSPNSREMLVRRLEMIPIEIIVRNIAIDSLCKRFGLTDGKIMEYPVTEYFLKGPEHQRQMINPSHAISFGYLKTDEWHMIERITTKINAILKSLFTRRGLNLADFKIEFGRFKNKILLADEISADTFRLIDEKSNEKLYRDWSESEAETAVAVYEKIKKRILTTR